MSRVGKVPVKTAGSQVSIEGQTVTVKGAKGELKLVVHENVRIKHANDEITLEPVDQSKLSRAQWGTARANLNNMVKGTKDGFTVELSMVGTGYRANVQGNILSLSLGYSHDIKYGMPKGVTAVCPVQTEIVLSGVDKQLVGQIAAEIRSFRKPEPYKGKGVKRKGEFVRRKEGKKK